MPASGIGYLVEFVQAQMAERLSHDNKESKTPSDNESKDDRQDFLSKLTRAHLRNPDEMTLSDVFGACLTNIGAGSDTTSIALTGILYYLYIAPACLAKVCPLHLQTSTSLPSLRTD